MPYFLDSHDSNDNQITKEVKIQLQKQVNVPFKKEMIIGAPRKIDAHDSYANKLLSQHLGRLVTGDNKEMHIDEIEEIWQQLVAGYLFKIKGQYEVEGVKKSCTISILNQPWTNGSDQVVISAKCDDGSCYVTESYTCSPDSLYSMQPQRHHRLMMFS